MIEPSIPMTKEHIDRIEHDLYALVDVREHIEGTRLQALIYTARLGAEFIKATTPQPTGGTL